MRTRANTIDLATGNGQLHVPPQNIEAEEAVLGGMMVSAYTFDPIFADIRLEADDFYRERHSIVFRAIKELYNRDEAVDSLTVTEFLVQQGQLEAAGGKEEVWALASTTPAPGNAVHYARIVKENALLRRLLEAAQRIQQSVHDRDGEPQNLVESAERLLFDVAHAEHASDFEALSEVISREVDRLDKIASGEMDSTGTPSGFVDLDALTGGFQPGNLIVIAARPAMGKSGLVLNIADHVARELGKPVALFSLEMAEMELAQRLIAFRSKVPSDKLRKAQVKSEWPKVLAASNEYENAPLWIDDSSDLGLLDLRAKARRLHAKMRNEGHDGLGLIIIDYIQLMRPAESKASRVEQVSQISRGLKILARELKVPVIGLSQLSRAPEQRTGNDKRPILSDLRESGQIEADSDVVAFIYRDEYYNPENEEARGIAEILVRKNRNGPVGKVELVFREVYASFLNKSRRDEPAVRHPGEEPLSAEVEGQF
jgi:replicative DNA helicase